LSAKQSPRLLDDLAYCTDFLWSVAHHLSADGAGMTITFDHVDTQARVIHFRLFEYATAKTTDVQLSETIFAGLMLEGPHDAAGYIQQAFG
jgi:hypothetical protein